MSYSIPFRDSRILRFAIIAFLTVAAVPEAAAQNWWRTIGGFQTISADPRIRALGEATVALQGTAGAAGQNPAAIGESGSVRISTNFSVQPVAGGLGGYLRGPIVGNVSSIATPSLDAKIGSWAAAYQYNSLRYGQWWSSPGGRAVFDRSHKIALAYDVLPSLTIGSAVNVIDSERSFPPGSDAEPESVRAVSFDAGILYRHAIGTPWGLLSAAAAWSLTDFGSPVEMTAGSDPLEIIMRGGLALRASSPWLLLRRPLWSAGVYGALSKRMVHVTVNGSDVTPDGPFRALFTSWKPFRIRTNPQNQSEAKFITVSAWDQINKHVGVELGLWNALYLRSGYFHEHEHNGSRQYTTVGLGLDLYYVVLDYSAVTTRDTALKDASFWRLMARVPLSADPQNFWPDLMREVRRSMR